MAIKIQATQRLPEWTKACPLPMKAIAIKDAVNAWFKAKNHKPKVCSRKDPKRSCYIPSSAIKETGIDLRMSGKGLCLSESLPELKMDSRLIWKASKWSLSLLQKTHVLSGENQTRVVAIDPSFKTFATIYTGDVVGYLGAGDFFVFKNLHII
jgi:putative transposase